MWRVLLIFIVVACQTQTLPEPSVSIRACDGTVLATCKRISTDHTITGCKIARGASLDQVITVFTQSLYQKDETLKIVLDDISK